MKLIQLKVTSFRSYKDETVIVLMISWCSLARTIPGVVNL